MLKIHNIFALSAISLVLAGCGSDDAQVNQTGSLSLAGTAKEGEVLTATVSDPDGIEASQIIYTWFANDNVITGATSSTYTLTVNEAGSQVSVSVTYVDNANTREGFASNTTAVVEALPVNFPGVITLSGSATVEQTLTATVADDNGLTGNIAYSWQADSVDIAGETTNMLLLTAAMEGAVITATAVYTDDENFAETVVSDATDTVGPVPLDNVVGTLDDPIAGDLEIGAILTAPTPVDDNGISGTIVYQWQSRDSGTDIATAADISGETSSTYTTVDNDLGKVISVNVSYIDDSNFDEMLTQTAVDEVFSFYVDGETAFADALTNIVENGTIGIASAAVGEDYTDMTEMAIATNNIVISLVEGSDAVISGTTCISFGASTTGVVIDGLVFDDIIIPNDDGSCEEGRGSVVLAGSMNVIRNSSFLGDDWTARNGLGSGDESHYISVQGEDNIIERNLFSGKSVNEGEEGTAISMFASKGADLNTTSGNDTRNIVQYNLFKDFLPTLIVDGDFDTDSGSHAVQIGRSGSSDGTALGAHILQYNRFDTVLSDRAMIVVQSSGNEIHTNTIVNSWGNTELRNGYGNTVSKNIIIAKGADYVETVGGVEGRNNKDGGISFAPLGHIIVDNYVANTSTDSSDRAALHIDSDSIDSGNSSSLELVASTLDLSVTIARNTFLDNRNAVQFEDNSNRDGVENCTLLDYVLDFDDNLFANQSADMNIFGTSAGSGAAAIKQDEYIDHGCALNNDSDYDNNHVYSDMVADRTPIFAKRDATSLTDGADGNILMDNTENGASLTAADANLLVEGTGADAGIGAAIADLTYIEESMVGPGSTWVATP